MTKLTISLAQMSVKSGNPRLKVELMQSLVEEAVRRGSQLIVFPEMWSAGYAINEWHDLAAPLNNGIFLQMATAAKVNKICITGSMPEKRGVGIYNTAPFYGPGGHTLGVYRKIHLFGLMGEDRVLNPGESPLNLKLPWGRTGLAICYDLRFPELFRRYGTEGAKMVLLPSAWPTTRIDHWRTLIRARAIENQYFMIACNAVGEAETDEGTTVFGGHSMIVDPWGETVLEAGNVQGLFTVDIDLDMVDEVRKRIPVYRDRRPKVYGQEDIMSTLEF